MLGINAAVESGTGSDFPVTSAEKDWQQANADAPPSETSPDWMDSDDGPARMPKGTKIAIIALGLCVLATVFLAIMLLIKAQERGQVVEQSAPSFTPSTPVEVDDFLASWTYLLILFILDTFFWILTTAWVARDAKSRCMDGAAIWAMVVFFLGFLGLIVYLVARPRGMLTTCHKCLNRKLSYARLCPHCGHTADMTEPMIDPSKLQRSNRLNPLSVPIWGIFLILLFFCLVGGGTVAVRNLFVLKPEPVLLEPAPRTIPIEPVDLSKVEQDLRKSERKIEDAKQAIRERTEDDAADPLATPAERRAAEAEKERERKAAEEEAIRQRKRELELDREREAARQRQMKSDEQDKAARKLLRSALQLKARGGFDKQVRERLQEIIDKYPDTPSANEAQRQLEKLKE